MEGRASCERFEQRWFLRTMLGPQYQAMDDEGWKYLDFSGPMSLETQHHKAIETSGRSTTGCEDERADKDIWEVMMYLKLSYFAANLKHVSTAKDFRYILHFQRVL